MFPGYDNVAPQGNWVRTDYGWRILPGVAIGESLEPTFALTRARSIHQTAKKETKTKVNNGVKLMRIAGANRPHNESCVEENESVVPAYQPHLTGIRGIANERKASMGLSDAIYRLEIPKIAFETHGVSYCSKLFEILLGKKLNSLSGTTQRQLFQVLGIMVSKALENEVRVDIMKDLLKVAADGMDEGKASFIGSKSLWKKHQDAVSNLIGQVQNFQYTEREDDGLPHLLDLPKECLHNILSHLSNPRDLVNVGVTCSYLHDLSTDPMIWQQMCIYHYTDKQLYPYIEEDEYWGVDWLQVFQLCYSQYRKHKELHFEFGNELYFCNLCRGVFWRMLGHPCLNPEQEPSSSPLSPSDFLSLFCI